jgi:hypothetical protein
MIQNEFAVFLILVVVGMVIVPALLDWFVGLLRKDHSIRVVDSGVGHPHESTLGTDGA